MDTRLLYGFYGAIALAILAAVFALVFVTTYQGA